MINSFPGYVYDRYKDKNLYMGEDIGRGGYVWAKPGIYHNVWTFDIQSQHPHSIIAMNVFGEYTDRFRDLLNARILIKHKDYDSAKKILDGKLAPYLDTPENAKMLSDALKVAINSCYGLTSAQFDNPMRDLRNKNNIVALRGALFMVTLKHKLLDMGAEVVHIKTDSCKIVNPSEDVKKFVIEFGKEYGYTFEIEHIFEKFCLVNNAVYIAKLAKDDPVDPGKWTATGAQFAVPYVFKTLFSKEPITFEDLCETKSVTGASNIYLDMNENLPDVSKEEAELDKLLKKEKKNGVTEDEQRRMADLPSIISTGHDYVFVGRVGRFCPIQSGKGGGILYREKEDKYYAVTGTTGYRWLEAELVHTLGRETDIDKGYFRALVDDAIKSIGEYGDPEAFINDDLPGFSVLPWCDEKDCRECPDRATCESLAVAYGEPETQAG